MGQSTHHDDITRLDADLIVTTSIERIKSPVVDHLHWLLLILLLEATGRSFLVKQIWARSLVYCREIRETEV